MTTIFLSIFALGVPLLFYLLRPLLKPPRFLQKINSKEFLTQTLISEREQLYATIAELDEEHEVGKISKQDYQNLRTSLIGEVSQLTRKSKNLKSNNSNQKQSPLTLEEEIQLYKKNRSRKK